MASVITALGNENCGLSELVHNDSVPVGAFKTRKLYVKKTGGVASGSAADLGGQVEDDEFESIARAVMAACKQPGRFHAIVQENDTLRRENRKLHDRMELLEEALERSLISVTKKSDRSKPASAPD